MSSFWKWATAAICAVTLCGAAIFWTIHRRTADQARLGQVANQAAEKGDAKAQYDLGHMYYHGEGVPQSYALAAEWYQRAAAQGYPAAEYGLGYMYQFGQGVSQDYSEAALWYRRAAEQSEPRAEVNLATLYYQGQGISQDYAEAAKLYRRAADQGDANGEDGLGLMYYYVLGVQQDFAETAKLYRKAADQGLAKAEYDLGVLYYYGRGVPQDRSQSKLWFRKAAQHGDRRAREFFGMKLTPWLAIVLGVQALAGFALAFRPFSLNMWEPSEGIKASRDWLSIGTGVLWLATAGLSWYGYTHNLIWCWINGLTGFTLFKWSLNVVSILLLFFVLFRGKLYRHEEQGTEAGGPPRVF